MRRARWRSGRTHDRWRVMLKGAGAALGGTQWLETLLVGPQPTKRALVDVRSLLLRIAETTDLDAVAGALSVVATAHDEQDELERAQETIDLLLAACRQVRIRGRAIDEVLRASGIDGGSIQEHARALCLMLLKWKRRPSPRKKPGSHPSRDALDADLAALHVSDRSRRKLLALVGKRPRSKK